MNILQVSFSVAILLKCVTTTDVTEYVTEVLGKNVFRSFTRDLMDEVVETSNDHDLTRLRNYQSQMVESHNDFLNRIEMARGNIKNQLFVWASSICLKLENMILSFWW